MAKTTITLGTYKLARLVTLVSPIRSLICKILNASGRLYCPVCESNVQHFRAFGDPQRANARCPICGSLERHRLDWVFFTKKTDLFDGAGKKMLHVAPEEFLSARLRRIEGLDYLSADLANPKAMIQMDITKIDRPDNTFHVIYCSHVLEHIRNDREAIAELYRVLRPGGWAALQVPVTVKRTYEDPEIVEPEERKKHFGQSDHVRRCGPDYIERIRDAGFEVQVLRSTDLMTEADCVRMAIQSDRFIFFCRKPIAQSQDAYQSRTRTYGRA
jgi:SAM-dependent methyltransferase